MSIRKRYWLRIEVIAAIYLLGLGLLSHELEGFAIGLLIGRAFWENYTRAEQEVKGNVQP